MGYVYVRVDELFEDSMKTTIAEDVRREHSAEKYAHPITTRELLGQLGRLGDLMSKVVGAEEN